MPYSKAQFIMLMQHLLESYEKHESSFQHILSEIKLGIEIYEKENE